MKVKIVGLRLIIGSRVTLVSRSKIRNVRLIDRANGWTLHHFFSDPIYVCKRVNGGMLVRLRQPRSQHKQVDVSRTESFSRSEEHTSELQSLVNLVCRLLLGKKIQVFYLMTMMVE